jgi:C4-dicarboxylate transporter/malic acid transport protein
MPAARASSQGSQKRQRRFSTSSLEGQRGTLQTSHKTLHGKIGFRDRIHHFTWAEFTGTMSTGGIALLLAQTPHRFKGLNAIGSIVFVFDICLFLCFCAAIATRFILFPRAFMASLSHPTESLFFPTFWISISNILSNIQDYGVPHCGPWLVVTLRVFFWIYVTCTFLVAVGQYFFLFTGKPLTIQSMTPAWLLPVFPVMLCGTLASLLSRSQPPEQALPILIAGISFQGLGMLIATFMYGGYLSRLMSQGLPSPNTRPGMFVAVGPPSFTGLALIGISQDLTQIYPSYSTITYISNPAAIPDIFRVIAVSAAVFLWATSFWFFSIALVSVVHGALGRRKGKEYGMSFHLVWWSFVFPNVGFTICTISIGKALMSEGILWIGTAMTLILVAVWFFVSIMYIRAVWKGQILWPGKDEDHDQ